MQICKLFTYDFTDIHKKIVDNPIDLYALRLTCKDSLKIIPNIAKSDIQYLMEYLCSSVLDYRFPYIWNVIRKYESGLRLRLPEYTHICRGEIDCPRVAISANTVVGLKKWLIGYIKYGNIKYSSLVLTIKTTVRDIYELQDIMDEYGLANHPKLTIMAILTGKVYPEDIKMFMEVCGRNCVVWDTKSRLKLSMHMHWKDYTKLAKMQYVGRHAVLCLRFPNKKTSWQYQRHDIAGISNYVEKLNDGVITEPDSRVLSDKLRKTLNGESFDMGKLIAISLIGNNLKGFNQINDNEFLSRILLMVVINNHVYLQPTETYPFQFKFWKLIPIVASCWVTLQHLYAYIAGDRCPHIVVTHKRYKYPKLNAIHAGMLYVLFGSSGRTLNVRSIFKWAENGETYLIYKLINRLSDIDHIRIEEVLCRLCVLYTRGMYGKTKKKYVEKAFLRISKNYYMLDKIKLALLFVCLPTDKTGFYRDTYLRLASNYISMIVG